MKKASVLFATALAAIVLPVPGGPVNKHPLGGSIPSAINFSGCKRGNSITSLSLVTYSLRPPISLKVTFGLCSTYMQDTAASNLGGKGKFIVNFEPISSGL